MFHDSVERTKERCSSREFAAWVAYQRIEPLGFDRLEVMIAQLSALVANALRGKGRAYRISDFLLFGVEGRATRQDDRTRIVTPEAQQLYLERLSAAMHAKAARAAAGAGS